MKEFSVPAMYSMNYLEELNKLNQRYGKNTIIHEVYGSMPGAPVGTIRPSSTLPKVEKEFLIEYIKKCREYNLSFNYIMNSTVLDGSEYIKEERKKIIDFIGEMVEAGLSGLTLSVPYLIKLVKEYFPTLKVTASICMEIDSVQRAMDIASLGVNSIVLAKDLNRNFTIIENIGKNFEGDIKILCTTPCIYKCSDIFYHMNLSSVRDNELNNSLKIKGKFIAHTAIQCQSRRLNNLEEYIRSPWIRPEDTDYYKKIGISQFKIDGRDKSEEYNLEVIEAYLSEQYDGNLLYLMQNYYPKDQNEMKELEENKDDFWKLGVYLDNQKLDGFLENFYTKKLNCDGGCTKCNYCSLWTKNSIMINNSNIQEYLGILNKENEERFSIE